MKKTIKLAAILLTSSMMLSSCYVYTVVVGNGPKGNQQTTKWNQYVLFGLAPVGVSDAKQMASGATDYSVTTKHSFVNYLCTGITFGIWAPTVTTVTK